MHIHTEMRRSQDLRRPSLTAGPRGSMALTQTGTSLPGMLSLVVTLNPSPSVPVALNALLRKGRLRTTQNIFLLYIQRALPAASRTHYTKTSPSFLSLFCKKKKLLGLCYLEFINKAHQIYITQKHFHSKVPFYMKDLLQQCCIRIQCTTADVVPLTSSM